MVNLMLTFYVSLSIFPLWIISFVLKKKFKSEKYWLNSLGSFIIPLLEVKDWFLVYLFHFSRVVYLADWNFNCGHSTVDFHMHLHLTIPYPTPWFHYNNIPLQLRKVSRNVHEFKIMKIIKLFNLKHFSIEVIRTQ